MSSPTPTLSLDLLVCHTCGTQFDVPYTQPLPGCKICADPRQYVPTTGQKWTCLRHELGKHENKWTRLPVQTNSNSNLTTPVPPDSATHTPPGRDIWSIETSPRLGIGERCILIKTPHGNILWDLIAYLDEPTTQWIMEQGGLAAIVISHPHYYTTHLDWSTTFDCPVFVASEDAEWLSRRSDGAGYVKMLTDQTTEVVPGVTAIKVRGHFPGSLVLHWDRMLLVADSLVTMPSALYHVNRPKGTSSFAFMYSIPNMIPLSPAALLSMWNALKPFDFNETHGAFTGQDVVDSNVKGRILESMKIQVRHSTGSEDYEICHEEWP